jgi:hypothetical protein
MWVFVACSRVNFTFTFTFTLPLVEAARCREILCKRGLYDFVIIGTGCVKNEDVLHRVKEEMNIIITVQRRKTNWIGHVLRRNCLLKHIIGGRRRKQLLDSFRK